MGIVTNTARGSAGSIFGTITATATAATTVVETAAKAIETLAVKADDMHADAVLKSKVHQHYRKTEVTLNAALEHDQLVQGIRSTYTTEEDRARFNKLHEEILAAIDA